MLRLAQAILILTLLLINVQTAIAVAQLAVTLELAHVLLAQVAII